MQAGKGPGPVIIGAGPAGLTAAYELTRRGVRPLVFERGNRLGGLSRTEVYKGFRFDIGGHRFYTKSQEVKDFWQEVLPREDFLEVERKSRVHFKGKFFQYPIGFFDTLS